jgi:hypothetical protein
MMAAGTVDARADYSDDLSVVSMAVTSVAWMVVRRAV